MRYSGVVRFRFSGDEAKAKRYITLARKHLGTVVNYAKGGKLNNVKRTFTLGDGSEIECLVYGNQKEIRIFSPIIEEINRNVTLCRGFIVRMNMTTPYDRDPYPHYLRCNLVAKEPRNEDEVRGVVHSQLVGDAVSNEVTPPDELDNGIEWADYEEGYGGEFRYGSLRYDRAEYKHLVDVPAPKLAHSAEPVEFSTFFSYYKDGYVDQSYLSPEYVANVDFIHKKIVKGEGWNSVPEGYSPITFCGSKKGLVAMDGVMGEVDIDGKYPLYSTDPTPWNDPSSKRFISDGGVVALFPKKANINELLGYDSSRDRDYGGGEKETFWQADPNEFLQPYASQFNGLLDTYRGDIPFPDDVIEWGGFTQHYTWFVPSDIQWGWGGAETPTLMCYETKVFWDFTHNDYREATISPDKSGGKYEIEVHGIRLANSNGNYPDPQPEDGLKYDVEVELFGSTVVTKVKFSGITGEEKDLIEILVNVPIEYNTGEEGLALSKLIAIKNR